MLFKYIATNVQGEVLKGERNVKSSEELIKVLKDEKLFCVSYKRKLDFKIEELCIPTSKKDIALFCKYMSTSLKSGMNICEILNLICYQFTNKRFSRGLSQIKESIQKGNTFSESMKKFPKLFPWFLSEMVYIGEESGKLQEIFYNIENYYSSSYKRNKKIISSLIYPAFTLILTLLVSFIMIMKILPQFTSHITNLQGELPKITKFYLNLGNFLSTYGGFLVLTGTLILLVTYYILNNILCISSFSFIFIKIPFVSSIYKKTFFSRFTYSMYILLDSGIDIISSINMIMRCEKNKWIYGMLINCSKGIESGQSIYESFTTLGVFPKFFNAMIHIGEENGNLDEMLKTANEIFENELSVSLERVSVLIEPILILFLGGFVGTIVLAIMIPLIKLSTVGL